MINRSAIKYFLKKILPKPIFGIISVIWEKVGIRIVEAIDSKRVKHFKETSLVKLAHSGKVFSLYISPENGFIDKHIFLYGVYEPFMLDLISKHLNEGMTFVDIGANIGQHSMYAAKIVGSGGSVYSYEPIPRIYEQLVRSAEVNGFSKIIQAKNYALGAKEARETFNISKNAGGSSLVNKDDTAETIEIMIKKGDEELLSLSKINMVKIDVEGYEYEVLCGIEKTLEKHHPCLLLEFSGEFYKKQNNGHGKKILELLTKHGYALYDVEDNMKLITELEKFNTEISERRNQTNLLCRHKDEI